MRAFDRLCRRLTRLGYPQRPGASSGAIGAVAMRLAGAPPEPWAAVMAERDGGTPVFGWTLFSTSEVIEVLALLAAEGADPRCFPIAWRGDRIATLCDDTGAVRASRSRGRGPWQELAPSLDDWLATFARALARREWQWEEACGELLPAADMPDDTVLRRHLSPAMLDGLREGLVAALATDDGPAVWPGAGVFRLRPGAGGPRLRFEPTGAFRAHAAGRPAEWPGLDVVPTWVSAAAPSCETPPCDLVDAVFAAGVAVAQAVGRGEVPEWPGLGRFAARLPPRPSTGWLDPHVLPTGPTPLFRAYPAAEAAIRTRRSPPGGPPPRGRGSCAHSSR